MVKLYGVTSGGYVGGGGVSFGNIDVVTSTSFREELKQFPEGTKVALEWFEKTPYHLVINDEDYELNDRYWPDIVSLCKERKFEIVYIDDLELLRKHLEKSAEARAKKDTSLNLWHDNGFLFPEYIEQESQRMSKESYDDLTEARYIHGIEREEKMLENIIRAQPDVVIVSSGFSDYWLTKAKELEKKGFAIESYARDQIPDNYEPLNHFGNNIAHALFIRNPLPDIKSLAEREQLIRKYNAVKKGRILPDKTPDWIGSWDDRTSEGLFEVYVDSKQGTGMMGTIEDVFGSASFTSITTDGIFYIFKVYSKEAKSIGASKSPVVYKCEMTNEDVLKGKYHFEHRKGEFWMKKFT